MIHLVFAALFPLIALIASGYLLKRTNWLDNGFWRSAEKLNYYVLFPVMLFLNLANAKVELNAILQVSSIALTLMLIATVILYMLKSVLNIEAARFGVQVQGILRFNTYIGLAVVSSLFHVAGMTIFAIIMVLCIPVVNVISVLSLTQSQNLKLKSVVLGLIKNPLILGCIVGGLYNYSGLQVWTGISQFLSLIASCSLPLGLMCVGAALQFKSMHKQIVPILSNSLIRLLIMPLAAYYICQFFDASLIVTQVMVLFFALPTASASYVLTRVYGGDYELMASVISLQTVIAACSLPLVLSFIL